MFLDNDVIGSTRDGGFQEDQRSGLVAGGDEEEVRALHPGPQPGVGQEAVEADRVPRTPVRQPAWSHELMRDYWRPEHERNAP